MPPSSPCHQFQQINFFLSVASLSGVKVKILEHLIFFNLQVIFYLKPPKALISSKPILQFLKHCNDMYAHHEFKIALD